MEPAKAEVEPFGRQPLPVTVTINGDEQIDVEYWMRKLMRDAEWAGDRSQKIASNQFKIYPRAVND